MYKFCVVFTVLACAWFCGCAKIQKALEIPPDEDKMARVSTEYKGESIDIVVTASGNSDSLTGVRHMRNHDWQPAADAFKKAIAANNEDFKSHFGLAVCDEMMQDYKDAEQEYKSANFWHADPAYEAGLRRAQATKK